MKGDRNTYKRKPEQSYNQHRSFQTQAKSRPRGGQQGAARNMRDVGQRSLELLTSADVVWAIHRWSPVTGQP